jgi:transcriptional regulator with XRE-family HTH domain
VYASCIHVSPVVGHRRVKGLRREEVALLAGVSVRYYVGMERGNLAGASDAVLAGVAPALRLDEAERVHLFALARSAGHAPPRRRRPPATAARPVVKQVLDAITEAPAWIRERAPRHPRDERSRRRSTRRS